MTKEQYIMVIKSVIESPRNNLQKIGMLQQGFKLYVEEHEEPEKKKAHWIPVQEHIWRMDGDEIDTWAWDSEYHNGPICNICGARPCVHCCPDWEKSECYDISYRCSECSAHKADKTNFCPDCGAEMEVT